MQNTSELYKKIVSGPFVVETRLAIGEEGLLTDEHGDVIFLGDDALLIDTGGPESAFDEDMIVSIDKPEHIFSDGPTLGCTPSQKVDITMRKPVIDAPFMARLALYSRVMNDSETSEWLPKGVFYADTDYVTKDYRTPTVTIRGFDAMLLAEQDYPSSTMAWPARDIDILKEIAAFLGICVDPETVAMMNRGYLFPYPAGYSCREVVGYLGMIYGGSIVISESGEFRLIKLNGIPKETSLMVTEMATSLSLVPEKMRCVSLSSQIASLTQNAASLTSGKLYGGYSKVILHVTTELAYTVGNDSGMTMELTMPFGTREIAQNILSDLVGYQYQSFDASDDLLDPAVQLGDALDVNGVYGGIYSMRSKMGKLFAADVGAPEVKQIDQTAKFKKSKDRQVVRDFMSVYAKLSIQADQIAAEVEQRKSEVEKLNASLAVQAGQIAAKVSKTGGDKGSFGWEMEYNHFTFYSNNKVLLDLREGLAQLTGKIGGFYIMKDYLSYNGQTWGGTNSVGGYLGFSGLQLGPRDGGFYVDMRGNMHAENGTFNGYVKAKRIEYGGDAGNLSGSAIEEHTLSGRRLEYGTVSTSYTSGGINTSLGYANFSNDVFDGNESVSYIKTGSLKLDGHYLNRASVTIAGVSLKYVSWI